MDIDQERCKYDYIRIIVLKLIKPYINFVQNFKESNRFRVIYSKQGKLFEPLLDLYESLYDFFAET